MDRRRRTCGLVLVGVLIAAVLALVAPMTALACSCAGPAVLAVQSAAADVVLTGRVRERSASAGSSSADRVTWILEVEKVFAGSAGAQHEVVTAASEASCGYEFTVGSTYLVLATGPASAGGPVTTGLCAGTRPATASALDELAAAGLVGAPPPAAPSEAPPAAALDADGMPAALVLVVGAVAVVAGAAVGLVARRAAPTAAPSAARRPSGSSRR